MHCRYSKTSLFCILLISSISVGTAHAYIDDDYSIMQKKSNGDLIYVSSSSVEPLVKRGYADPLTELNKNCVNVASQDMDCSVVRNDQNELCFFSSDPQACLATFDKPENHDDCKMFYKFYAIYQIDPIRESEGFMKNTPIIKYDNFSFHYCDLEREADTYTLEYQVTHDVSFVANQGIPSTLYCVFVFQNDNLLGNEYYRCKFSSAKETFIAGAGMEPDTPGYTFNVYTKEEIENWRSTGLLKDLKDRLRLRSANVSGGLCISCE